MDSANQIERLLVKVLLQEANEAEKKEVTHWLEASELNRRHYYEFQKIWQESRQLSKQNPISEEAAWARFKARVNPAPIPLERSRKLSSSWLQIAAVLLSIISIAVTVLLNQYTTPTLVTQQSTTAPLTDTLSDGSIIHLNKKSSITYASNFTKGHQREVQLEGEAFFEIAKDPNKPFIVQVNDTQITVLGTSFNVKSNPENTEVIVESGLVEVAKAHKKIKVAPNEMVIIAKSEDTILKKPKPNDLYNYYFSPVLTCQDMPLQALVEKLSEIYAVPIQIENSTLKKRQINTVLNKERSLNQNLEVVTQTLGITTYTKSDTIFLK